MKQSSTDSDNMDSTIADLDQNDFSISVTKAIKKSSADDSKSQGGYFSSFMQTQFVVYQIETKSRLPEYLSEDKVHTVTRRFSDFEHLLQIIQSNEEYKQCCFPPLPEKRMYGNLDDTFINQRRLELEGFLRVLVKINQTIKRDKHINAFLTQDDEKYKEYLENPNTFIKKMQSVYQLTPGMPNM